jgi:hypothetical protein
MPSRNWSAIALAGLLFAIGSAPMHAQVALPLLRVILYVGGAAEVLYSGTDRAEAEAVQKANPGSKIMTFGSHVRPLNDSIRLDQKAYREWAIKCNRDPSSCRNPSEPDFDHGQSLKD